MENTRHMKMTPVGLIPEDWVVATIKDYGHLLSDGINPQQYREKDFVEYSMPAYDDGQSPTKCKGADMNSNRTHIKGEVLLFNKLNVRQKRVWYIENAPSNALCSMEFLAYSSDKVDLRLLREILLQDSVTKGFESVSRGTSNSQKRITPSDFLNFSFALPPLAEQHRIADALSGVDDMVGALDVAIAKKRLIKEGLMQQLLTGKTRLPGFSGKWKESTLGQLVDICKGVQFDSDLFSENGRYPMLNGGITPSGYSEFFNAEADTITISEGGNSCGYVNYMTEKFWCGGHCYSLKVKSVDKLFLYQLLKFNEKDIMALRVGSGLPNVQSKSLIDFRLYFSEDEREQKSISNILKKADDEIASLESQRDKYTLIKQGMMQELLTGKTRLI